LSVKHSHTSENEVVLFWQEQVQKQRYWADTEGKSVEIVYPGRLNDSRGGDFRDALVGSSLGANPGCIEVHTSASGWRSHGHHKDTAYNRVVLHVVLEADRPGLTVLQNGQNIPTIALNESALNNRLQNRFAAGLPCKGIGRRWKPFSIVEALAGAGDIRFESAISRFSTSTEAGQSLFEGILEALGYSKNKVPFKALGGFLPLSCLEQIIRSCSSEEESLIKVQAILFGKAGLLPSQRHLVATDEVYVKSIEANWAAYSLSSSLSLRDWELFKVRPGNYPVRRIAALSYLLHIWKEKGCFESLLDLVRRVSLNRSDIDLEAAFLTPARGYWANHLDFNARKFKQNAFLLGRARAAEIIVNVVLPFISAWGELNSEAELSLKARQIYNSYPSLQTNSLEKHMLNQLALNRKQVNFARYQQGLIHIYKTLCIQGKCSECTFST
jgi:hypothetical protein